MGKGITYSEPTHYREYAVRLRALADNPRNPAEEGALGTDWAIDDPAAIVEKGSNANGSYTMYVGGRIIQWSGVRNFNRWSVGGSSYSWLYPCRMAVFCSVVINGITYSANSGTGDLVALYNQAIGDIKQKMMLASRSIARSEDRYVITGQGTLTGTWY